MENIFLKYQEFYQGSDSLGQKPFRKFDTALEHKSNNTELVWGQFIKKGSTNVFSDVSIDRINNNPGYVFFSDGKKIYYGKIIEILNNRNQRIVNYQNEIPFYYSQLVKKNNLNYEFEIGFWVRIGFFRELKKEIFNYLLTSNQSSIKNLFHSPVSRAFVFFSKNFSEKMIPNYEKNQLLYNHEVIPNNESNYVYGKKIDNGVEVSISLTNPLMIDRDHAFLVSEQNQEDKEDYRPYLYEFLVNEEYQQKLSEYMEDGIFYKIKFVDKKEEYQFVGTVIYSASKIETFEDVKIKVIEKLESDSSEFKKLNDIDEKINFLLVITKDKVCFSNYLKNVTPIMNCGGVSNIDVNIYNVGQANWISIIVKGKCKENNSIVFDCGHSVYHKKENALNNNFSKALSEASIFETDLYILSHWDLDHINGSLKISTENLKKAWIFPEPEIKNMTNLGKRLLAFIIINANYCCISNELRDSVFFSNDFFKIGKGNGDGPKNYIEKKNSDGNKYAYRTSYTLENNLGLILEFNVNDENILLSGDCEYIQFPEDFLKEYKYVILPHHGAYVNEICLPRNKSFVESTGIFCAGEYGRKKYPDLYHENIIKHVKNYNTISSKDFLDFVKIIKL